MLLGAAALAVAGLPLAGVAGTAARADGTVKIGLILPLSGIFASEGHQYENGIKVYQKLHGTKVAGKDVVIVTRDDQGPGGGELSRRFSQELLVREKADILLGYSFTPNAMATAALLNEAKKPAVIINAATSIITEKSPYFVRVSFTLPQIASTLGAWAAKNGIKTAYTMVSDYAPGIDAEKWFKKAFTEGGGKVVGSVRTPLAATEYSPYLQRVVEAKPDALFAFNPGGDVAVAFMKNVRERDLAGAGIKVLVTGDVVPDDTLPAIGSAADGVISAMHYQMTLDNPANKAFLKAYKELYGADARPSFRAIQAYDAMDLIYKAVEKTGGKLDTDSLMAAFKGMTLDSPRGPVEIDPKTRDVVQNIYVRKTQKVDGQWENVAFETVKAVKDPGK